ncbi:hypothetical protein ACFLTG_00735 [Chloroflexota bacterium]
MERKEIYKFWASIGITAGLAILFFGITQTGNNLGVAWFDIIAGIFLIIVGLVVAGKAGMFKKL